MIEKQVARNLLPLVNDIHNYNSLINYVRMRIVEQQKITDGSNNMEDILRAQGAIRELKRIFNLREETIADSKKE